MSEPTIVRVAHGFDVPPQRVFDAWLNPDQLGRWMFGPAVRDEEIVRLSVDPRVGGKFSFIVNRQGTVIDHIGEYRQIDRPHRLSFTWGVAGESTEESIVTINITPQPSDCELTLTHEMDAKWTEFAERIEASWTKMLEALAASLI